MSVRERYGLTPSDCNRVVSDCHLQKVSCKDWRLLPCHLGLNTIVVKDIDRSLGEERGKRYDFLLQWKQMKGSEATYVKLIGALEKISCKLDAESLCMLLKGPSSQPHTSAREEPDSEVASQDLPHQNSSDANTESAEIGNSMQ